MPTNAASAISGMRNAGCDRPTMNTRRVSNEPIAMLIPNTSAVRIVEPASLLDTKNTMMAVTTVDGILKVSR